jgi:hypothetical protein
MAAHQVVCVIAEVRKIAKRANCTRLWVITANDNVDALRFYGAA